MRDGQSCLKQVVLDLLEDVQRQLLALPVGRRPWDGPLDRAGPACRDVRLSRLAAVLELEVGRLRLAGRHVRVVEQFDRAQIPVHAVVLPAL